MLAFIKNIANEVIIIRSGCFIFGLQGAMPSLVRYLSRFVFGNSRLVTSIAK